MTRQFEEEVLPDVLDVVIDSLSEKPVSAGLDGWTLAEIFEEWKDVHKAFNDNKSGVMFHVFGAVEAELEARMVEAGVHSPADAAAVIAWHKLSCVEMMYDWDFDAVYGTSGALLAAIEAYGAPKDEPPIANDNPPAAPPAADAVAEDEIDDHLAEYLRGLTVGRCATIGEDKTPWLVAGRSGDTLILVRSDEGRRCVIHADRSDVTLGVFWSDVRAAVEAA